MQIKGLIKTKIYKNKGNNQNTKFLNTKKTHLKLMYMIDLVEKEAYQIQYNIHCDYNIQTMTELRPNVGHLIKCEQVSLASL